MLKLNQYASLIQELNYNLVDVKFGVIQHIGRFYPELEIPGIYHYYAYMSNTQAFCQQDNVRYGKGVAINEELAMLKAIGEGVERYASAIYNKNNFLFSTFKNLDAQAISPDKFCLYSDEFYKVHSNYVRFAEDKKVRWVKGLDLKTRAEVYIPAAMVYLPYKIDDDENKIIQNISTGLASHSSYENAAINAICEVIERDAFMICWRNQLAPVQIDLSTLPLYMRNILNNYYLKGFDIKLFNITTDIQVPVTLGLMETDQAGQPPLIIAGACSASFENAMLSTIEELEHARQHGCYLLEQCCDEPPIVVANLVKTQKDHARFWHNHENLHYIDFLKQSNKSVSYDDLVVMDIQPKVNILDELCHKIWNCNLNLYLVDITPVDIASVGLSVIRAIIPGAHPLSFGFGFDQFACPRLSSAPQAMGFNCSREKNLIPHPYP